MGCNNELYLQINLSCYVRVTHAVQYFFKTVLYINYLKQPKANVAFGIELFLIQYMAKQC